MLISVNELLLFEVDGGTLVEPRAVTFENERNGRSIPRIAAW
jgi:hypothetical protein